MKKKATGIKIVSFLLAIQIGCMGVGFAQNPDKKEKQIQKEQAVSALVASHRFVFVPLSATPMSGRTRQLTPDYALTIKKDSIESYLPYYGRAYNASYGGIDDHWNFKSTHFEYKLLASKKDGWDIYIKPTDASGGQTLNLHVSSTGFASLQVISNDRESISYYGSISALN